MEKKRSIIILFGTLVPVVFGGVTLIGTLFLPFFPIISNFMGNSLVLIQMPLIIGGGLLFIGGILVPIQVEWAKNLIQCGAIIGIITWPALLALIFLRNTSNSPVFPKRKSYAHLLFLPIILYGLSMLVFITDSADHGTIPWFWRGRNGLTFWETFWDQDVFWGELWFNLLLITLISAALLMKFPAQSPNIWRLSSKQQRILMYITSSISLGIPIFMLLTAPIRVDILKNWYSTQFAYQLPMWPALIGFLLIFIGGIRIQASSNSKKISVPFICLLMIFSGIWIFLSSITNFHLHALTNFGMQIYTLAMTIGYPLSLLVYILQRLKNLTSESLQGNEQNHIRTLSIWIGGLILLVGSGLLIGLQFWSSTVVPSLGYDTMFPFEVQWSWQLSHWPGWLWIGTCCLTITFGIHIMTHRRIAKESTIKTNSNSKLVENQNSSLYVLKSKISIQNRPIAIGLIIILISLMITSPLVVIQKQQASKKVDLLLVNQIGYTPNSSKRVVFQAFDTRALPLTASFDVLNSENQEIAYSGFLYNSVIRYGHAYMVGQFDNLSTPGNYFVRTNMNNEEIVSYAFEIDDNVYDKTLERVMRFFTYQRCNYAVPELVTGYPGHAACHLTDAEVWNGTSWIQHSLLGGWHDAGDYNKYDSWFQTQWYCTQALAEAALLDPEGIYSAMPSLIDSTFPDALDEALWGIYFLVNCVNIEGYQGENARYLIWETVSGYRHWENREARMSYWGPPEMDWTTPRRVVFNQYNTTFLGYYRAYAIAGTILQAARLIDTYHTAYPEINFPIWVPTNTTYLRELAYHVYERNLLQQGSSPDNVESFIGKFFYWEERGLYEGENWTVIDSLVPQFLPSIPSVQDYPLWFGWSWYYLLGNLLTHYISYNRTIPLQVLNMLSAIQAGHFNELFEEPFLIKHGRVNGSTVLFYGAERQTDMLTSAWLQSLIYKVNATLGQPILVQSMLDWLMGANPVNICLIESVGQKNLPQYHHRYSYARNPSGAVPGAIPNGIALISCNKDYAATHDIPYTGESMLDNFGDLPYVLDWPGNPLYRDIVSSNNEVWIPHNAMFLRIFTALNL